MFGSPLAGWFAGMVVINARCARQTAGLLAALLQPAKHALPIQPVLLAQQTLLLAPACLVLLGRAVKSALVDLTALVVTAAILVSAAVMGEPVAQGLLPSQIANVHRAMVSW